MASDIAIVQDGSGDPRSYLRDDSSVGEVVYTAARASARIDASVIAADLNAGRRVIVDSGNDRFTRAGDIVIFSQPGVEPTGATLDFSRFLLRADKNVIVNAISTFVLPATIEIWANDLVINLESPASDGAAATIDLAADLNVTNSIFVNGSRHNDRVFVNGPDVQRLNIIAMSPTTASIQTGTFDIRLAGIENVFARFNVADTTVQFPIATANDIALRDHVDRGFIELSDNRSAFPKTVIANPTRQLNLRVGDAGDSLTISPLDVDYAASLIVDGGAGTDRLNLDGVTVADTPGRGLSVNAVESVSIVNSSFIGNSADLGGGVLLRNVESASLSNVVIADNTADSGGGIAVVDSVVLITASEITNNRSTRRVLGGGGVYARSTRRFDGDLLTIATSNISENSSAGEGGGIFIIGAGISISDSTIDSNVASGGAGGGISGLSNGVAGDVVLRRTSVTNNSSSRSGGGVAVLGTGVDFANVTITGNTSATIGGGIDSSNDDPARERVFVDTVISGNTAAAGQSNFAQTGLSIEIGQNVVVRNESFDVSGDGQITALDALRVINAMARLRTVSFEQLSEVPIRELTDVNGDGKTTAIDALMILNQLGNP